MRTGVSRTGGVSAASRSHAMPRTPGGDAGVRLEEDECMDAEAFSSVHDLVHHAILSQPGSCASLRQIYDTCERQGRIAYKRSGGSRIITANEHWKSQIRHALYTSARFCRAAEMDDAWCVARGHDEKPATTTVRVSVSASVIVTPNTSKRGDGLPASGSASRKRAAGSTTPKSGSTSGRAGKSGLASARRAKGAKGTSSRGQLFQPTPEPMTPAHGVAATPALRASQRRGRGMKRLKTEQDGYDLWSEEDGWMEEDQTVSQEGDDDDSMEEWETTAREAAVSFRDPTRNRRKPAKEVEVSTYSPSESPEPAPAPRDVSRNRRKGKAARAAGVMGAEPVKPMSSGRKGAALSRKQPRWEAAMVSTANNLKENGVLINEQRVDESKVGRM